MLFSRGQPRCAREEGAENVQPAPRQDDLELARGAIARDQAAIERLVRRMHCVPRFISHLNARYAPPLDRESLEDLVQDVLTVVWRRLPEFRGGGSLESWSFRICDFLVRNAKRRASPRQSMSLQETQELADKPAVSPFEHERLGLSLDSLPALESMILRLKHYEGLTFHQIGTRLGVSPNTVKTRYYRGLESLRRQLRKAEGGD